jgi:putative phosphoesterase
MPRGSRDLPAECLRCLTTADLILHAGDFVAAEVYERLGGLGRLEAVHGNMDDDELKRLLPATKVIEVDGLKIGLAHEPQKLRLLEGCDAVVYGHTHRPEVAQHDGMWVLNPGSPTERRRSAAHSMLMVEVTGNSLEPELVTLS